MNLRNQSLDVLRGIAILLVVVAHYHIVIDSSREIFQTMGRGVDLFFVLSGFLISGLLFSEYEDTGELKITRFWIRRAFKIYPAFYFFLFFAIVFVFPHPNGKQLAAEIFFLQNYLPRLFGHTWSLAVEEHFYLALPVLLVLLSRLFPKSQNPFRAVPLISVFLCMICLLFRFMAISRGETYGAATHQRVDALFVGVALSYFQHFDRTSFREARKTWVLVVGVVVSLVLIIMPPFLQLIFAYVASAFVLAWAVNQPQNLPRNRVSSKLAWLGRYSYSIYLWHVIAVHWFALLNLPHWMGFPGYVGSCVLLGVATSKLIEFPSLRLREKLFPSRARASSTSKVAEVRAARI